MSSMSGTDQALRGPKRGRQYESCGGVAIQTLDVAHFCRKSFIYSQILHLFNESTTIYYLTNE